MDKNAKMANIKAKERKAQGRRIKKPENWKNIKKIYMNR